MSQERFSRREREIMEVLFALGSRATAEQIRAALTDPPSSSAIRAMLARLTAKGHVRRRAEGLRYLYFPTTPPAIARRKALQRHLRTFFAGSAAELATSLLRQEPWSDQELDTLEREIRRVRKERKS